LEQAANSFDEAASGSGQYGVARHRAALFQHSQRRRVSASVSTQCHHGVIAAVLALVANQPRYPPDSRMIKQQSFDEILQQADHVIASQQVRQLMNEDVLHM